MYKTITGKQALIILGNGGDVEFYHPISNTWYSLIHSNQHVKCVLNDSFEFQTRVENLVYC